MYRILVCDDEWLVREGIVKEAEAFPELEISTVENGEEVLSVLREKQVDGLILDICMPKVSGIDVLREMSNMQGNNTAVIILSGHDEFEYAQAAMAYGASEYILKPVTPQAVKKALRTLVRQIEKRRALQEEIKTLTQQLQKIRPAIRDRFFQDLLDGKIERERIANVKSFLGIDEDAAQYQVVLLGAAIENGSDSKGEEEYQLKLFALGEIIEKKLSGLRECILFHISTKLFALLVTDCGGIAALMTEVEALQETFGTDYGVLLRAGIGSSVEDLRNLRQSYSDAQQALFYAEEIDAGSIVGIKDIKTNPDPLSFQIDRENIMTQIKYQNIPEAITILEKIGKRLQSEAGFVSFDALQLLCVNAVAGALGVLEEVCGNLENYYKASGGYPVAVLADQLTARELMKKTTEYLLEIQQYTKTNTRQKNRAIIEKSKAILAERCCEALGVGDVAEALGLSKNYFGQLFKSETGSTVSEYLNLLRIDQAKKLLRQTNLKIYEIAYKIGFSDHFYFSIVFKKLVGISPKEYREL